MNELTNVNNIKFGKVFFLGKKTGLSLDDNIKTSGTVLAQYKLADLEQFMVGSFNGSKMS